MNHCSFIGNLTRDPELRSLASGTKVVQFGIAVNRKYKNKNGELVNEPTFLDLEAWDSGAQVIADHFAKGDPIVIEDSSAKTEQWEAADGTKRSRLKFRVNRFSFPPGRRKDKEGAEGGGEGSSAPAKKSGSRKPKKEDGEPALAAGVDEESSIPF